jgi:hypothetical protein
VRASSALVSRVSILMSSLLGFVPNRRLPG